MQKITRNTFQKGLNTDLEAGKLPPEQYTDAHNIELVGDGSFFAAKNIKGTTNVEFLSGADGIEVIGVFENKYKIQGSNKKCLTIFTMEDYNVLDAEPGEALFTGNNLTMYVSSPPGPATITAASGSYNLTGTAITFGLKSQYYIKGTQTSKPNACSLISLATGYSSVYSSVNSPASFVVGSTRLYTDLALTTPFVGSGVGVFYKIAKPAAFSIEYGVEVSPGGIILSVASC